MKTQYAQLRIKEVYRNRLRVLAKRHNRSMANMIEVLIDKSLAETPPEWVKKHPEMRDE